MKSIIAFVLVLTSTTVSLGSSMSNFAFSQAVDLIDIHTSNETLNSGLPHFYDCIDDKVSSSKGVEEDPYFEKEPTKNEVAICYHETFEGNSQINNGLDENVDQEEN